jgi:hypothetical protein
MQKKEYYDNLKIPSGKGKLSDETITEMVRFLVAEKLMTVQYLASLIRTQIRIVEKILAGKKPKTTRATKYLLVVIFLANKK